MRHKKIIKNNFLVVIIIFLLIGCVTQNKDDCLSEVDKMKSKVNFRNSGLDSEEVEIFFCKIKRMIDKNLKEELSEIIFYPQEVVIDNKWMVINTKEDFIKHYNDIINEYVKSTVMNQRYSDLFSTSSGVMIGEGGAIWITKDMEKGKMYIFKINNISPYLKQPTNKKSIKIKP